MNVLQNFIKFSKVLETNTLKEIVTFLIEKGIDINSIDRTGRNILLTYLKRIDATEDVVKILIESGVNINHTCRKRYNALV
jgi:hypothetical protein